MSKFSLADAVFDKRHPYEVALLCSFGLDLNFLENYLLRLNALASCEAIGIIIDPATYDQLADRGYQPRDLNRRYLVATIRSSRVFHSKLALLASEKKALLAIGSGNLTRAGVASNFELLSTFTIDEKNQARGPLFRDALAYLEQLAADIGASTLLDQVTLLSQLIGPLLPAPRTTDLHFLHNLRQPLLDQMVALLHGKSITSIQVISPFFDRRLAAYRALREYWPAASIELLVQQQKSNFPLHMFEQLDERTRLLCYENIDRYLHGKALLFTATDEIFLFVGSANFSRPALLEAASVGNYEVGVFGRTDPETRAAIVAPDGIQPMVVRHAGELEVDQREALPRAGGSVRCLIEAVLQQRRLQLTVDPAQTAGFDPRKVKIEASDGAEALAAYRADQDVALPAVIKRGQPLRATLVAADGRRSNSVWIVDLVEARGDPQRRRVRRVLHNPETLIDILNDLVEADDDVQIRQFLQQLDIKAELLRSGRRLTRAFERASAGNIMGSLPLHRQSRLYDELIEEFAGWIRRHLKKLDQHGRQPRIDAVGNCILILETTVRMIDWVGQWAIGRVQQKEAMSAEDWKFVRKSHDQLVQFIDELWLSIWGRHAYQTRIDALFAEQEAQEQDETARDFNEALRQYDIPQPTLLAMLLSVLERFSAVCATKQVVTPTGRRVPPKIFARNHMNLQPHHLETTRRRLTR